MKKLAVSNKCHTWRKACVKVCTFLTINTRKVFFFCPESSFVHLAPVTFYITVTGPKGGSTITGQNKVTYLLVIDPDKYGSVYWK